MTQPTERPWPKHTKQLSVFQPETGPLWSVCYLCGHLWPCPGREKEVQQVLESARSFTTFTAYKLWREQELLPILRAGE